MLWGRMLMIIPVASKLDVTEVFIDQMIVVMYNKSTFKADLLTNQVCT